MRIMAYFHQNLTYKAPPTTLPAITFNDVIRKEWMRREKDKREWQKKWMIKLTTLVKRVTRFHIDASSFSDKSAIEKMYFYI
jgi:hypothetical protein